MVGGRRLAIAIAIVARHLAPAAARGADFSVDGDAALAALIGDPGARDARVRKQVASHGFYDGAPLGVGACETCHPDVAAQWSSSAHRFASFNNPYYAASVRALRDERGGAATRFCANCHDPVTLAGQPAAFDGSARLDEARPDAQAGIVCLVCHSIREAPDPRGNGRYHLALDPVPGPGAAHATRLRSPMLGDPRLCGGCHKVGLDETVTAARFRRGQDEYDGWRDAAISGRGAPSVRRPNAAQRCQDCHMPLEPAPLGDAAAREGPDGRPMIRSHRFLGANAALPHLRGDTDAEARTVAMLQGAVSLDLAPAPAVGQHAVDVVLRARRVGHRFPGGTEDSNEVWIELSALDGRGRVLARSGRIDPDGALSAEAHRVRAQPVDAEARPLARRDVQHLRGVVFDTGLAPSDPQAIRYRIPTGARSLRARLLYRKFDRAYVRFACLAVGDPAARLRCESPPVIQVAHAEATLLPDGAVPAPTDGERLLDHGLALAAGLVERAAEARDPLERAAVLLPERVEPPLALARVATALGRTDEALAILDRLDPVAAPPAALWLRATALHHAYRDRAARVAIDALVARLPDDRLTLGLAARLHGLDGDPRGALALADRLLAVDPESEEGLFQRSLALRDLGDRAGAATAEREWARLRVEVETDLALRRRFRAARPALPDESEPLHVHDLPPE